MRCIVLQKAIFAFLYVIKSDINYYVQWSLSPNYALRCIDWMMSTIDFRTRHNEKQQLKCLKVIICYYIELGDS